MPGRNLDARSRYAGSYDHRPDTARRRAVLRETVQALAQGGRARFHALAASNLARWKLAHDAHAAPVREPGPRITVVPDDWGVATARATRDAGAHFAVLNMANAFVPGGAYVEGAVAQEENLFRRTDCHEALDDAEMDKARERYTPAMTALLSARDGVVYLDVRAPRVCFRGPEDRTREDLGYRWLADDEVFSFFELRAAAEDLRDGRPFDRREADRRIRAQIETLRRAGLRRAVLSAFGCGAFHNPATEVAALYRAALEDNRDALDEVVFAVFAPGYGPDNFTPFAKTFAAPLGAR